MSLKEIKDKRSQGGFTIVELLIVIVIIAVLAAIVVVAYNGLTNRAKHTSAKSAAEAVAKKAEAYNAETGSYPTTFAQLTGAASSTTYYINPSTVTRVSNYGSPTATAPTDEATIIYYTCTGGGVRIGYWNYEANAAVTTTSTIVAGNPTGTCTVAAS